MHRCSCGKRLHDEASIISALRAFHSHRRQNLVKYTCHARCSDTLEIYFHGSKLPQLIVLFVVCIQESSSVVSVAGMIKVYNAAGELYALNPAQLISDDLLMSIYKEARR